MASSVVEYSVFMFWFVRILGRKEAISKLINVPPMLSTLQSCHSVLHLCSENVILMQSDRRRARRRRRG